MKILAIYGAGGLGREVYVLARKVNAVSSRWKEFFFIDDNLSDSQCNGLPVYKLDSILEKVPELEVAVGIGEPEVRELLYRRLKTYGISLATILHPGVYVDETSRVGDGVIACEGVILSCNVNIGNNVYLQPHALIGHDTVVGSHSVIGGNAFISGTNRIKDRVYFGFNSGTKENISVGNDVICSAGAVVFRDLPDEVIAVGNPARIMKRNERHRVFKKSINDENHLPCGGGYSYQLNNKTVLFFNMWEAVQ